VMSCSTICSILSVFTVSSFRKSSRG
jgi:hypothetical protein